MKKRETRRKGSFHKCRIVEGTAGVNTIYFLFFQSIVGFTELVYFRSLNQESQRLNGSPFDFGQIAVKFFFS